MKIFDVFAALLKAGIAGAAIAFATGIATGILLPLAFNLELSHEGSYEGAGMFAVVFAPFGGVIAGVVGWLGWAIGRGTAVRPRALNWLGSPVGAACVGAISLGTIYGCLWIFLIGPPSTKFAGSIIVVVSGAAAGVFGRLAGKSSLS